MQPERTLEFEVGSILLTLPAGVALPARGQAKLTLSGQAINVGFHAGQLSCPPSCAEIQSGGRTLRFDLLPAGTHELWFRLIDLRAPADKVDSVSGGRAKRRPMYEATAAVTIRAGEVTEVALR